MNRMTASEVPSNNQAHNGLSISNLTVISTMTNAKQNGEISPQIDTNFIELSPSGDLSVSQTSFDAMSNKEPDKMFGWEKFKPKFLQRFCNAKWALFWLCWGGAMQGLIVNGFINVVITTIERRFGLRSRQTGLVASGYDIASFVCLVPVTYFGGRVGASKPKILAWGVILMGIGSLTFALPHFLVSSYRATMSDSNVCQSSATNGTHYETCSSEADTFAEQENLSWTVWLFFLAQLLHGAGASPLFTLGVTYIDENVSTKMSSVYLGIFYTMAIIGPAVGYVLGGQLLLIYTEFMTVDASDLGLTSSSKVWIGAWWIGFIFAAIACFLLSIPIFGYPSSLPGAKELQQQKVSEAYNADVQKIEQTFTKLKDMPSALLSLLKNPTFFCLNMAGATEGLVIAGFAAFLPKQIENQFSISPVWSALLMGLITVPAGGGGTFLGGYLIKKLKLNCANIIKMCLIMTTISAFFTSCFLLSCPNLAFAGVTTQYRREVLKDSAKEMTNLTDGVERSYLGMELQSSCNVDCGCSKLNYEPICGADGILYYSPCFAGCHEEYHMNQVKIYTNCSCIDKQMFDDGDTPDATNLMCKSTCHYLSYFVGLCFVLMLFTFLSTMPALSATLRCVRDDQRSFALGIQWIKVRLFGTIPAPMIFGKLIDDSCILWQETCDEDGSGVGACLVYDNYNMSKYMWLLALVGKTLSVIFFFGALWFYIPPKKSAINSDNSQTVNNSADITKVATVEAK
ncbi:solute carrier organic anion transporter family member 4A1 [Bactrocera neohumeralis]|uniref:solute carrier organic anion transporter family member 4A1 n=1 Tax=Bactrocera neohumeralis TaxID=98809 RepID=UPI002165FD5D|nr:solute carrier organic anion transporter family member 4A1 [Bactrocera neohumeralis]